MKRLTLVLIVVGCLPVSSPSSWLQVPLNELVQSSDLIVVGTLNSVFEHTQEGTDYGEGSITIEEILWGHATPGGTVILKWQNDSNVVCPRVEHRQNETKIGIWLLTVEDGGIVRANYPGRFVELGQRAKVEKFLQESKVSIRANKYVVNTFEPINLSVVFRNPTESPIKFPGLEFQDGYLYVSPDITVAITRGWGDNSERVSLRADRVLISKDLAPITVQPGQEHRCVVDVSQLLDVVPGERYCLYVIVKGYGFSAAGFYYANQRDQQTREIPKEEPSARTGPFDSRVGISMLSTIGIIGISLSCFVYTQGRGRTYR